MCSRPAQLRKQCMRRLLFSQEEATENLTDTSLQDIWHLHKVSTTKHPTRDWWVALCARKRRAPPQNHSRSQTRCPPSVFAKMSKEFRGRRHRKASLECHPSSHAFTPHPKIIHMTPRAWAGQEHLFNGVFSLLRCGRQNLCATRTVSSLSVSVDYVLPLAVLVTVGSFGFLMVCFHHK